LSDLLDRLHEREMTIAQVEDAIRAKYPPPVPDPIEYVYLLTAPLFSKLYRDEGYALRQREKFGGTIERSRVEWVPVED
jgi:hypothetical protein